MSKLNALYTSRVAPGLTFEFEECVNAPVEVVGYFTRRSNGFGQKMTKPPKGRYFDLEDESTELFWVLKIGGVDDLVVQNVANLNGMQGFTACITVSDGRASFKDGATVTKSGDVIKFSIQA
jgi:hypothetical protein